MTLIHWYQRDSPWRLSEWQHYVKVSPVPRCKRTLVNTDNVYLRLLLETLNSSRAYRDKENAWTWFTSSTCTRLIICDRDCNSLLIFASRAVNEFSVNSGKSISNIPRLKRDESGKLRSSRALSSRQLTRVSLYFRIEKNTEMWS